MKYQNAKELIERWIDSEEAIPGDQVGNILEALELLLGSYVVAGSAEEEKYKEFHREILSELRTDSQIELG